MENIYYVQAISLQELTEELLNKEYEIHKIKYNQPKLTKEQFLKFMEDWHQSKYDIDSFISSYHETLEEAKEYAQRNIGDINEAGCYNYAAVCKAPLGLTYYNTGQNAKEDFILYKYDRESHSYKELAKDVPEYKSLLEHVWGMISFYEN